MEWLPMHLASMDGEDILATIEVAGERKVDLIFWDDGDEAWKSSTNHDGNEHAIVEPVSWMDLTPDRA